MNILPVVVLYNSRLQSTNAYHSLLQTYHGSFLIYENSSEPLNKSLESKTVFYRHDRQNGGVSAAYNYAGMLARRLGNIDALLFLDEDSRFPSDYMWVLESEMAKHPEISTFVPQVIYRNYEPFSPTYRSSLKTKRGVVLKEGVYSLKKYLPVNSGACIRMTAFERVRGYNQDIRLDFADFDFFSRLAIYEGKFYKLKSDVLQSFSNETTDTNRLFERFKIYIEGAHVARRNGEISTMVRRDVWRHTFALTFRTFSMRFMMEMLRHF